MIDKNENQRQAAEEVDPCVASLSECRRLERSLTSGHVSDNASLPHMPIGCSRLFIARFIVFFDLGSRRLWCCLLPRRLKAWPDPHVPLRRSRSHRREANTWRSHGRETDGAAACRNSRCGIAITSSAAEIWPTQRSAG